jgi:hypothetical protein
MKRIICLALCLYFLFGIVSTVSAQKLPPTATKGAQLIISASLGAPILRLWGYGAPGTKIELSGQGVYDLTYTGSDGYFEFANAFLPTANSDLLYPELCLTEIDNLGRATPPTCIPALPAIELSYDIGPVLIPPTLSLDTGTTTPSSQAQAEGVTIPNSSVKVILAEDKVNGSATGFKIVEPALAYYIPNYTVESDAQGNFSFNMPSTSPDTWHVFVITNFSQGTISPKSNTLKFQVISPATQAIENFWASLLSLLTLPALIVAEVILILLIITAIFLNRKGKRKEYPTTS